MKVTTTVSGGNRYPQKIRELEARLKKKAVLVGLPKGLGNYEDGTPIAVIGAVQEYGSADGHIPERSFLRVPLKASQKMFVSLFRKLLPMVMSELMTPRQMLGQIGAKAVAVSQEAINAGIDPPNAPSTVARKESATPLIDHGTLKQSVTYVIEGEEDVS